MLATPRKGAKLSWLRRTHHSEWPQCDSVSPCSFPRKAGRATFPNSPEFPPGMLGNGASSSDVPSSSLPSCERYQPSIFLVVLMEELRGTKRPGCHSLPNSYQFLHPHLKTAWRQAPFSLQHAELQRNGNPWNTFNCETACTPVPKERWRQTKWDGTWVTAPWICFEISNTGHGSREFSVTKS